MSDVLTVEKLKEALELLQSNEPEKPVYYAPPWVYDDPEKREMFIREAQRFHLFDCVEVRRIEPIPDSTETPKAE